jgi:hypothetical protein
MMVNSAICVPLELKCHQLVCYALALEATKLITIGDLLGGG